jgi:chorismate-pyruvate lyase
MLDAAAFRPAALDVEWHGTWTPRDADGAAAVAELPPLSRLLLTTDGTVTTALATIADEPVAVRLLGQQMVAIDGDDAELALWAGANVLDRRVVLHGAASARPLLYGATRIVPHRLPREARDMLLGGDVAIGLVLRALELETFRIPLSIGIKPASDAAAAQLGTGPMCVRRYAITRAGRPVMIVREEFPADGFGAA